MFAKIQNAYQVLSDPQERAFYDRHRESILRKSKSTGSRVAEGGYSVDDLMTFFDPSVFKGYGDDPKGFYSVYRDLFAFLEDLEAEECDNPAKYNYTSFGSKNSPFEPSLKLFYDKFLHFSSIRAFYEADNYDDGYAENRRHRRAIGKENQKFRDAMRREYTDTVRNLAAWVRKRDPRWQAYQKERTAQRLQAEARRKEENAKRRAEMADNYVAPEWAAVNDQCIDDEEFLLQQLERLRFEEFASTAQDSETAEIDDNDSDGLDEFDDFYCVVCKKVFKNHKQWKNHEQSKKHKTNMLKAGFKPDSESEFDSEIESDESEMGGNMDVEQASDHESSCENEDDDNLTACESIDKDGSVSVDSSSDTETQQDAESIMNFLKQDDSDNEIGKQKPPKKKNRQRKQPSEQQQQPKAKSSASAKSKKKDTHTHNNQNTLKCSVCGESFDSRNKLFRHIDETGHAALKTKKK